MNASEKLFFMFLAHSALLVWPLYSAEQPSGASPEAPLLPELSINVSGEVKRPGTVQLPNGSTVLDALTAAGGLKEWADLRKMRILRKNGETMIVNLQMIAEGKTAPRALRKGDRLFLPKMMFSRYN